MEIKALDTNILVRFLVRDDEVQARKVFELFRKAQEKGEEYFVPLVVVLEMIWVLEAVYRIHRKQILDAIKDLLDLPILRFEAREAVQAFLRTALKSSVDLSDILICCVAREKGCEKILTFDKRAAKFEGFELLS